MVDRYGMMANRIVEGDDPLGMVMPDYGDLMRQARQQQVFSGLSQLGAGLLQAGMGGPYGSRQRGIGQAMQAFGRGTQANPMDAIKARYMMGQIQQQQATSAASAAKAAAQGRVQQRLARGETLDQIRADPGGRSDIAAAGEFDWLTEETPSQKLERDKELADYRSGLPKVPTGMLPREEGGYAYDPEYLAGQAYLRRAGKPQVTVTQEQETEFAKTLGKQQAETFNEIQAGARNAMAQNQNLDALNQALDQVYTGTGGQALQSARKVARLLGAEGLESEIAAGEAGQAISGRLALQLRNPAGGAGMPGAMSDADRAFLQSLTPTIATSPEGRRLVTEILKRQNQRAVDVAAMARDYLNENGNMIGFEQRLAAEFASNPEEDLFADLQAPGAAPVAATPAVDMSDEELMKGLGF